MMSEQSPNPRGSNRPKVAVLIPQEMRDRIFPPSVEAALADFAEPLMFSDEALKNGDLAPKLAGVPAVITGWKSPALPEGVLAPEGSVQLVSHAAGSVLNLGVKDALAEAKIRVSHSAPVIGEAVAEFTISQILAHLRRHREMDGGLRNGTGWFELRDSQLGRLLRTQKVGLVGMGYIGRMVLDLLRPFRCEVMAYDPFLDEAEAKRLGVTLCDLDTLFSECTVVSLHAPNIEATNGMITRAHLDQMADDALLVNTARAGLVEKGALMEVLKEGRIYAAIDVYDVEPLPENDPIRSLPKVYLSPHCAGHSRDSYVLQGLSAVEDVRRFFTGEKLLQEIPPSKANSMA